MCLRKLANNMVKEDPGYSLSELYYEHKTVYVDSVLLVIENYQGEQYNYIKFLGSSIEIETRKVYTPYSIVFPNNECVDADINHGNIIKKLHRLGYELTETYPNTKMKETGTYY